jgi:uncharacterized membrane protein HdeD (DUF308 family)
MMTSKARGFGLLIFLSGLWEIASVFLKQTVGLGAVFWLIFGALSAVFGLILLGQKGDSE